jgi:hypothetical protein
MTLGLELAASAHVRFGSLADIVQRPEAVAYPATAPPQAEGWATLIAGGVEGAGSA